MALRIRQDGRVVCAAFNDPEDGDVYLDDAAQYRLAVEMGVLVTPDDGDSWQFVRPRNATLRAIGR
jgi:hypothetical protein